MHLPQQTNMNKEAAGLNNSCIINYYIRGVYTVSGWESFFQKGGVLNLDIESVVTLTIELCV